MPRTLRFVPFNAAPDEPRADVRNLHQHLLSALELELATIPPYLCALYSIAPGTNLEAAAVIRSVVMEEMLHMALAANVLNAVGYTDPIPFDEFAAPYPKQLPYQTASVVVGLRRFSREALGAFMAIEQPASREGRPDPEAGYRTIGQFYRSIEEMIALACRQLGEARVFTGDASRQVTPDRWYYGGGGDLVVVTDERSAIDALRQITEQGEGVDGSIEDADRVRFHDEEEVAHYYRFQELQRGRRFLPLDTPASGPRGTEIPIDWDAVAPMCPDPLAERYAAYPAVHGQMARFNAIYTRLLRTLGRAFGGTPDALRDAVPVMYELRYQAEALMRIPSPLAPERAEGWTIGPSFEWDGGAATGQ